MKLENMINIVKARSALGHILSSRSGAPEELQQLLGMAHDALLRYERKFPEEEAQAFRTIAGPRDEWEIG